MRTGSSWLEDFSLFGVSCQNSTWTFQNRTFCIFFGVYLLSIQGTKALSLCFVLKLLHCLSDLYLSLSLVSWFSCKIKEKEKKKTPCLPSFTVIHSSGHQIHVRRLMLWNFNRSLTSLIQQWQRAERLALGCADSGRLTLPRPQLVPPGDSPWKACLRLTRLPPPTRTCDTAKSQALTRGQPKREGKRKLINSKRHHLTAQWITTNRGPAVWDLGDKKSLTFFIYAHNIFFHIFL